jgi:hypothetical protein
MSRRFVILTTPWYECIAAGVPFLTEPGDSIVMIDPRLYRGPRVDRGVRETDVIMNPHRAPELAPVWQAYPEHVILYETENLIGSCLWREKSQTVRITCKANRWWNYSAANAEVFGDEPRPLRLPGAPAARTREPDLDVVFVGSMNQRRNRIVDRLYSRGLRVACTTGPIFGAALASLEARARVVLNVHYYTPGVFEAFRVVPAVARGSVVVSEASLNGEGAEFCARTAPYDQLVATVIEQVELMKAAA